MGVSRGAEGPLFYAAIALAIVRNRDGALDIYSHIVANNPGKLKVWYKRIDQLAWLLAIRADSHPGYGTAAIELAQQAVKLAPQDAKVWTTLGVAYYRTGAWKSAIAALEKSAELRKGGDEFDTLFLAMAHWQVGNKDKAVQCYDQVVDRVTVNNVHYERIRRVQAEAAELLGVP